MDGKKLVAARLRKGYTQPELADKLQVGVSTIQRWESGECTPHPLNLHQLCEELGFTPEEVLGSALKVPMELLSVSPVPMASEEPEHLQAFVHQDLTLRLLSLTAGPYRPYQEIHTDMARILKDYDSMTPKNLHINRREALLRLASLSLVSPIIADALKNEETPSATICKEILAQGAVSVGALWELPRSAEHSDLVLAFEGASTYLPILQRIVKDSSEYRQEAASLATQCLLLKVKIGHHTKGLQEATHYAQQALFYSDASKDISLRLAAFEALTLMYSYSKKYGQALQTIEQAEPLLKYIKQQKLPISPYVLALTDGMLACTYARNGQDGTAYLDQARDVFPDKEQGCPCYVVYSKTVLRTDAAIVYTHQGEGAKALDILSHSIDPETLTMKTNLSWGNKERIEDINIMTMASLTEEDRSMERVIHFWQAGIQGAKALKSEQRYSEAVHAYEIMQYIWPREKRIVELRDLMQHW